MDAVLLAGGFGTRLRPLTYTKPKPLIPVAGRPMVEWVLDRLPAEVDRVIVAVNWLADALEEHFAASPRDLEVIVVRETEPLGTAGAVKNCQDHIRGDFFVMNADIVSDMDLGAMLAQHRETGAVGTIALKDVPRNEVIHYGVVALEGTRITGFVEKPKDPQDAPSTAINAGAYLLAHRVLDLIPEGLVSMEKEIFPLLLDQGFHGWHHDGLWIDVGDPGRLRAASHALDPHFVGGDVEGVVVESILGQGAIVEPGARVEHSVVGDRVTVRSGSIVRAAVVGDDEVIDGETTGLVWSRPVPDGYPEKQVGNALT